MNQELVDWGNQAQQAWNPVVQPAGMFGIGNDTWAKWLGGKAADGTSITGIAPTAFNAISGIMGAWNGMQQLDLAKDQFAFQKQAFNKNWAAQTKLLNSQMRDRQNARNAADDAAYQDTTDYMRENEVK